MHTGRERREAQSDWWTRSGSRPPASRFRPTRSSGGNQQKIVVAKWLATEPKVLLLDEPTKGVDVGAKFEIHEIIRREAARGAGCLVVSSDLPEMLALADRILVMREGRIQGRARRRRGDRRIRHAPGHSRGSPLEETLAGSRAQHRRDPGDRDPVLHLVALARGGRARIRSSTPSNALLILKYSSIYGIAAVGAAIVIISGGIDLVARRGDRALGRRRRRSSSWSAAGRCGPSDDARACSSASRPGSSARGWSCSSSCRRSSRRSASWASRAALAFIITEGRYFDVSSKLLARLASARPPGRLARAARHDRAGAGLPGADDARSSGAERCSPSAATKRRRSSPGLPSAASRLGLRAGRAPRRRGRGGPGDGPGPGQGRPRDRLRAGYHRLGGRRRRQPGRRPRLGGRRRARHADLRRAAERAAADSRARRSTIG